MAPVADAALDTLFLPMASGALDWPAPGGTLFLRARAGVALNAARRHKPVCEQSFRPWADALERDGLAVSEANSGRFARVLVLAPRQRDESRALLARALAQLAPGGVVVACAANKEGARSMQDDLVRLAGPVHSLSKHHCRVCWTAPLADNVDTALQAEWRALDAPRPIAGGRFLSRPGLFAWDRIDAGSERLVAQAAAAPRMVGAALAKTVTCSTPYIWSATPIGSPEPVSLPWHIVAFDFGIKFNILRRLSGVGCRARFHRLPRVCVRFRKAILTLCLTQVTAMRSAR